MSLGGPAHAQLLAAAARSPGPTVDMTRADTTDRCTLLVEGSRFIVDCAVMTQHPETMLGRMLSLRGRADTGELLRPNDRGEYEVAEGISANCFKAILVRCLLFVVW